MTRINLLPPSELSDQHLMAEYRELPMVNAALTRSLASASGFDPRRIPDRYTLNAGHVLFFYDKGPWLLSRYAQLIAELRFRGYAVDPDAREVRWDHFLPGGGWEADPEAVEVSRARIIERLRLKPAWYRWTARRRPDYAVDFMFDFL